MDRVTNVTTALPHWLSRKTGDLALDKRAEFDEYFRQAVLEGPTASYTLPYPKHEFLAFLTDYKELAFHGSTHNDIDRLEPVRLTTDLSEFGNRQMLFGTPDAIWAMWFAILEKTRSLGTTNSCIPVRDVSGVRYTLYFFAIGQTAINASPYVNGTLYVTSPDPFTERQGVQWGCTSPIEPLLKIPVSPLDFPYLEYVKGFDGAAIRRKFKSDPIIGDQLDDREMFPHSPEIPMEISGSRVVNPSFYPENNGIRVV